MLTAKNTTLRIDIKAFSRKVRELRDGWGEYEIDLWEGNYREYLACEMKTERHFWQPKSAMTAEDFAATVATAARAAYSAGATPAQQRFLCDIAKKWVAKTGRGFADIGGNSMTVLKKNECSRLIDALKNDLN